MYYDRRLAVRCEKKKENANMLVPLGHSFKIRMHGSPLGTDSVDGVVAQQTAQEINAAGIQGRNDFGQLLAMPLRETGLEIGQVDYVGPDRLVGRAEHPEDLENLVYLTVTAKDGLAVTHLGKDAAYGPDVDAGAVLLATKQDLGRPVP